MNSYTQNAAAVPPWRVMLCVSAYAMMAMLTLMVLVGGVRLGVKYAEQYGWLLRGEVVYAEDWTSEQREAVDEFIDNLSSGKNSLLLPYAGEEFWYGDWSELGAWSYAARKDELVMPLVAEIDATVRRAVQGTPPTQTDYGSVAHVAADMNCFAAARAFIERYPEVLRYKTSTGEDLLTLTLSNHSEDTSQEVLAMGEWLMEQGLAPEHSAAMLCAIQTSDLPAELMEWLIAKGLPLDARRETWHRGIPFDGCVEENMGVDVFARLVNEGKIDINDRRGRGTYLQLAVEGCGDVALVERLLKLGAQPDLLPEPYCIKADDGEYTHISETPVAIALRCYARQDPESEDEESADYHEILRLLFRYGAAPQPLPAEWVHEDNRRAAEEVYREFSHPIIIQTTESES